MPEIIIGVMGPGDDPEEKDLDNSYNLGCLIGKEGWILLTGGRKAGVMDSAGRGAKETGGQTLGILPSADKTAMSEYVDIPVITGMGGGRNIINVLTSDIIIACGMGCGTASEISFALKAGKNVILLDCPKEAVEFFKYLKTGKVFIASNPEEAVVLVKSLLQEC